MAAFAPSPREAAAADVTPPAAITDLSVSTASAGALSLSWSAPADDAHGGAIVGGYYRIDYSMDPGHEFYSTIFQVQLPTTTSPGRRETVLATDLSGNASYYARVYAGDDMGNFAAPSNAAVGVTRAYAPSAPTHTGDSIGAISWTWGDGSNQAGTEYAAQDGAESRDWLVSTSWPSAGSKVPNTRYTLQVKARDRMGLETVYASTTACTAIEVPSGVIFDMIGVTSVTARAFGSFTNLTTGLSGLRLVNETQGTDSGWQQTTSWTSEGLVPNTLYSIAVHSRNGDAEEAGQTSAATATRLAAPQAQDLALVADSSTQLTISVTVPPNPQQMSTGSEFVYVSGVGGHGSGRLTGAYGYVLPGLGPNTCHTFRVRYYDTLNRATAFSPDRRVCTRAVQPSFADYSGDGEDRLKLSWGAETNPPGTEFLAEVSADGFATVYASSRTRNAYAVFQGLEPGRAYWSRVAALNDDDVPTGLTDLGMIPLAALPERPRHDSHTTSSILWGWLPGAANPPDTPYYAEDESGSSGWDPGSAGWASQGKAANTRYTLRVRARTSRGLETASVSTSAYTSIEAAQGLSLDSVGMTSITVRALGSFSHLPSGLSGVRITDEARGTDSGWSKGVAWIYDGLSPNTLCSFTGRSRNGDGDETAPTAPLSAATVLPAPLDPDLTATADGPDQLTLTLAQPANPTLGATGSEFLKLEGVGGGSGSGKLNGTYAYVAGGLSPNARYVYRARYYNAVNVATDPGPARVIHTLAAQPAPQAYGGDGEDRLRANWGTSGNVPGTEYVAEVSSDGFVSLVTSSRTLNAYAVFQGLAPGGTFEVRVKAVNGDGASTGWTGLGTVTLVRPPREPRHSSDALASVAWAWDLGAGNPAGTEYRADDDSGSSGWVPDAAAWLSAGKTPNTPATLRVKARNSSGAESAALSTSAYTAIEAPTGVGFDSVGVTSVAVRALGAFSNLALGRSGVLLTNETSGAGSGWLRSAAWTSASLAPNTLYTFTARSRNGDAEEQPAATGLTATGLYPPQAADLSLVAVSSTELALSVAPPPNPSLVATGSEFIPVEGAGSHGSGILTGAYAYHETGLSPNTRYGFKVAYRNAANQPSEASPVKYRSTLASQPEVRFYTDIWDEELRANWGTSGNAPDTEYVAELSTDAFSTLVTSSRTRNDYAVFQGLLPDTLYASRVRAVNREGVATPWTDLSAVRTLSAAPGEPTHLGHDLQSIIWAWPKGSNPQGTEYRAFDETGDTGWVPDLTRWVSGGKAPNQAYTLSVKSRNAFGLETPAVSTSAYTSVEAPAGVDFLSIGSSSLTVRVLPGLSNPASGRSGARVFDETLGTDSGWVRSGEWAALSLASNTLYAFSVMVRNGDGEESLRTASRSTWTLLEAPSDGDWALSAGSSVQILLSVAPPPNRSAAATGCQFESVEGPGGAGSGRLTGAYASSNGGLSPDTRYGYRVRYFNAAGAASAWSAVKTRYTLASPPLAQALTELAVSSFTARWSENGNLPGTRYRLQLSTDGYSTLVAAPLAAGASFSFSGLTPNTTYSARVLALNSEDEPTAFTDLGSVVTHAQAPENPTITEAGGEHVRAAWDGAGNPPATLYELQVSTSPDYSPPRVSSVTANAWAVIEGLAPGTTYYARVRADGWGRPTDFVPAGSTVTLPDATLPSAVTDLRASPGELEGSIRLSWTAPGDDGASGAAARYVVKWSPVPIASQGAFDTAAEYAQAWVPLPAGGAESRLLTGLVPGATYHLSVEAVDDCLNHGGLPASAKAWAQWDITPPSAASDLAVVVVAPDSVRLSWAAPGDDGGSGNAREYDLRYSPLGPLDTTAKFMAALRAAVPAPAPPGSAESFTLRGLAEGTTYYFALRTADERPNWSALSPVLWAFTPNSLPPAAPRWTAQPASVSAGVLTLDWLDGEEADLAGYRVLRSTRAGGPYRTAATLGADRSRFTDPDFLPGSTYYYALTAFDLGGLESALSPELEVYSPDLLAPEAPAGLRAFLLDDGRYRLEWQAAAAEEDSSPLADLAGYRIYRAAQAAGVPALAAALSSSTLSWTEAAPQGPAYFRVRAFDTHGNEGADSLVAAPDLGVSAVSADGDASLRLSRSAAAVLYREGNPYGEDLRLSVERVPSEETGRVLRSYSVALRTAGSRRAADAALASARPRPQLAFKVPGYGPAPTSEGSRSAPSRTYGSPMSGTAAGVAVFWYDGADWIKLGGELDRASGLLTLETAHAGSFQVRTSLRSESLSLMQVVPQKIFTPNGDGINDAIEFFFDNPSDSVISQARVYDLTGAEVADMKRGSAGTSFSWDGKDSSGRIVSGGIYIYQFQAEGRTINGTVVVAK